MDKLRQGKVLVKTPRVVVRDDAVPDAKTYKSRLYHIYNDDEVKDDLNRRAKPEEPLPDLVLNAYYLLGYDWRETYKAWKKMGHPTPPVMITVGNRTETAARVKHAFGTKHIHIDELCDPECILHIDSKVLEQAEAQEEPVATFADEEGGKEHDKVKRRYLEEWAQAVSAHGGFGHWRCAIAKKPGEIRDILTRDTG